MTFISDPSFGGTLPITPITPTAPPIASPPTPKTPTSLDLINNRIQSLISEYDTLSNQIADHTLSELTAKASPTDLPKVKEAQDAIAKITGQLTEVDKNLDAEFKKLDDIYTTVVEQEKGDAKSKKEGGPKSPADTKSSAESPILPEIFASAHKWSGEVAQLVDKMTRLKTELSEVDPDHPLGKILDEKAAQLRGMSDKRIKHLQKASKAEISTIAQESGKALQAGMAAIRETQYIPVADDTRNPVYIAGKIAVFKKGEAIPEERLIESLSHFYPGAGVLSGISVKRARPIQGSSTIPSQQEKLRSVSLSDLDVRKAAKSRMLKHLSPEDSAAINNFLKRGLVGIYPDITFEPLMSDEQNELYKQLDKYNWSYELPTGKVTLTLSQVLLIYFEEGLEAMDKVALIPKVGETAPPPTKESLIEMLKSHGPNFIIIKGDSLVPPAARKEVLTEYQLLPQVYKRIFPHLSQKDAYALETYILRNPVKPGEPTPDIRIIPLMDGEQKYAYEKCELHKWRYEQSKGKYVELNFHDVQNLYFLHGDDIINKLSRIDIPAAPGVYGPAPLPPTLDDVRTAFGIIERPVDEIFAAEALCQGTKWQDNTGKAIDFSKFQVLYSTTYGHNLGTALSNYKPVDARVTEEIIRSALDFTATISFGVVLPELVTADVHAITNARVKPFADMILMEDVIFRTNKEQIMKSIGERLTPEAQVQMVLTVLFQFLDLHAKNIGIAPIPNEEYDRFKGDPKFRENLIKHLEGNLPPDTSLITYIAEDGSEQKKLLKDFPEYQKALNVQFKFALFDTDLSMSESNQLQVQQRRSTSLIPEHLEACRNALLESSLKDVPIGREARDILAKAYANQEALLAWVRREDSTLIRKLSALDAAINREKAASKKEGGASKKEEPSKKKEEVLAILAPYIAQLTLAKARAIKSSTTIEDLRNDFATFLSKIGTGSTPDIIKLWEILEEAMSVKTTKIQTLENFAEEHPNIDLKDLGDLNPGLGVKDPLPIGTVIKTVDLTSTTPEAQANRFKAAHQLFPNLTKPQETALIERQESCHTYYSEYDKFVEAIAKPENQNAKAIKAITNYYYSASSTPLSEAQKEQLNKRFVEIALSDDLAEALKLAREVQRMCTPTFFNTSKAMLPLLADTYALSGFLHKVPGGYIGYHGEPLEDQIAAAKTKIETSRKDIERVKKNIEALKKEAAPAGIDPASHAKKNADKIAKAQQDIASTEAQIVRMERVIGRIEAAIASPTVPHGYLGLFD